MYCPHCGQRVSANAKACGHCGQWLAQSPTAPQAADIAKRRAGLPVGAIAILAGLALVFVALLVLLLFLLFSPHNPGGSF
jgi:uncharacterized membrane protein YvbJ